MTTFAAIWFFLSIPITGIIEYKMGIDGGWFSLVPFFIVLFSPVILYLIGMPLISIIFAPFIKAEEDKKKAEAEAKLAKENEEITKRNEEVTKYNNTIYAAEMEKRRYTIEKAKELFALYKPIQDKEIEELTDKGWAIQKQVNKCRSDAYLPYEQEYYNLVKEFGYIGESTLNEIANLLLTHRVETIKEAYDVIEMRDHNAKMEAIAKDAARAEEIARQEAREREIIAERKADIRAAAERKWREQEQRERDQRAKEDHERRVKNYTKACDQLERAQYSPLGEFAKESARRKKDKAYAELMGR